jgi:hypothetical protein
MTIDHYKNIQRQIDNFTYIPFLLTDIYSAKHIEESGVVNGFTAALFGAHKLSPGNEDSVHRHSAKIFVVVYNEQNDAADKFLFLAPFNKDGGFRTLGKTGLEQVGSHLGDPLFSKVDLATHYNEKLTSAGFVPRTWNIVYLENVVEKTPIDWRTSDKNIPELYSSFLSIYAAFNHSF